MFVTNTTTSSITTAITYNCNNYNYYRKFFLLMYKCVENTKIITGRVGEELVSWTRSAEVLL